MKVMSARLAALSTCLLLAIPTHAQPNPAPAPATQPATQPASQPASAPVPAPKPAAKQTFKVSGTVKDAKSGNGMAGVKVSEPKTGTSTVTDELGAYALQLPRGSYTLTFATEGYKQVERKLTVTKDLTLSPKLASTAMMLDKMTVVGIKKNEKITSTEMSVEKFQIEELAQVPVFMGEKDIMKTLQLTPGITTITEGRAGFIVRGSGIDQNMILMDGMPLYYTSHMQGLYSVFNSDAVNSLAIYKGGTPARYGGRAASVLDVRMIGDEVDRFRAKLSIGLITSKVALQVPVIKDRLWISLAARSSALSIGNMHDVIKDDCDEDAPDAKLGKGGACSRTSGGAYMGKGGVGEGDFYFFGRPESWYDINPKLVWKISEQHRLNWTGFFSEDNSILIGETWWGNRATALKWNAQWSEKLLSETTAYYSEYFTDNVNGIYIFHSGIKTGGFRHAFSWFPAKYMSVTTGWDLEYQDYDHGTLQDTTQDTGGKFMPHMQSLETAVHGGVEIKDILPGLTAYAGLRWSLFFRLGSGETHEWDPSTNEALPGTTVPHGGGEVMATHHNPEPRLNLTYAFSDWQSVKFSYNRSAQYLRLMTNSMQLTWYDVWMPSTENVPSMTTDQWGLGYFASLFDNQIEASAEGYYKKHTDVADFEDGLHNYLVDNLEAYVATGDGRSYGLELMVKKSKGWFTGWISYNVGRSEQQIDGINRSEWYPSKFDKTHDLSMLLSVEPLSRFMPGHKLYFTALFLFQTGNAVTLPEGYYYISGIPFPYWEGRNRYRLPAYHRLDLGIKYEVDIWRTLKTSFELSFYNVYNRRNVNTISYALNTAGKSGGTVDPNAPLFNPYGVSFYGFRPSFTLTVEY
jgi:CarboxypepD_reg-like domain/TonB-dependent Receptor Plug Domain